MTLEWRTTGKRMLLALGSGYSLAYLIIMPPGQKPPRTKAPFPLPPAQNKQSL